jgi:hypothetical protein
MSNDRELAMRHAFDLPRLQCHAQRTEPCSQFSVAKACTSKCGSAPMRIEIVLAVRRCSQVRLDLILSRGLDLPRSRIVRLAEKGLIESIPSTRKGVSGPIADGQCIAIDLSRLDSEICAALTRAALVGASRASP